MLFGNILDRIFQQRSGLRQVFTLGLGTALGQGLVVLASPIWARLYSPADFGRFGLLTSFLGVAAVGVTLRYDLAVPTARNPEEGIRLMILCFLLTIPVSVIAGFCVAILSMANCLGFGEISPWSGAVVALILVFIGIFSTLRFWRVGKGDFDDISRALVVQGVGRAIAPVLMAPMHLGWIGLIAGEVAGRIFGVGRLALRVLPEIRSVFQNTKFSDLTRLARHFRLYPLVFLPSSVLDAASGAFAMPVFVLLYGVSTGGEFLMAQQVVMMPAALICSSLADVFHSRFLSGTRVSRDYLPKLVWQMAGRMVLLATVVYLPASVLAFYLSVPLFGPSWLSVGKFIVLLAPAAIITMAVSPVTRALVLSRIPQIKFFADVGKIVLPLGGLLFGASLNKGDPAAGLGWYSAMTVLSNILYFGIVWYAVRPENQISLLDADK